MLSANARLIGIMRYQIIMIQMIYCYANRNDDQMKNEM